MKVKPIPKPKTYRSEEYLSLVRSKGCLICGKEAEAHHMSLGDARWGGKSDDRGCIPLCDEHHKLFHEDPQSFGRLISWEEVFECMYWLEREWIGRMDDRINDLMDLIQEANNYLSGGGCGATSVRGAAKLWGRVKNSGA